MSGSQIYTRKIMNRSGFVLFQPNVESMADLIDDDIDIWEESATQQFPLGSKLYRGEQQWHYCYNGAVTGVAGAPVQSAAAVHADQDDDIVTGAAAAAGDYTIELTSTADLDTGVLATAGGLTGGYIIINDEAGEGHLYKVADHEIFSTTDNSTITLYDPLKVALTVASQVGVIPSPFYGVIATTAVCTRMVLGCYPFAVTASYYFWLPTGGPAACVAHAGIAVGDLVVAGTTAAKADPAAALTTESLIGWAMTPAIADTESFIVYIIPK